MIIVMNLNAGEPAIEAVIRKIRDYGLDVNVSRGTERIVIGAIGDERKLARGCSPPCPASSSRCTS